MTRKTSLDPAFLKEWQPTTSGNARLELSAVPAGETPALRMDFDFKEGGGFVVAKRRLQRSMPEDYAVLFRLRGRSPPIDLEIKLVDPTGRNVWRHVAKDLSAAARWTRRRVESRDIDFGWGPQGGGGIAELGSIEFAIVSSVAGAGTLWIGDVRIENAGPSQPPEVTASSELPGFEGSRALGSGWKPRGDDPRPWIAIDSLQPRRVGGLIVDWLNEAPAAGFRVRGSVRGKRWRTLYTAKRSAGKRSYVYLPDTEVRFLRLELAQPAGAAVRMQSFEFSRSIEAFWYNVARDEARGWTPRWLHREQTLWTPIGTSNGTQCALMNDDGMVEVSEGSFSIEPMLWVHDRLVTWSDVVSRQELLEEWMPVPSVLWETAEWRLRIRAETSDSGVLRVRYGLENLGSGVLSARLFVLIRPFQVTPPWQNFRRLGGVSRVHDVVFRDGAVHVNEGASLVPWPAPTAFAALCFDEGFMAAHLAAGTWPRGTSAHDAFGFATAALKFELSLEPRQVAETLVVSVAPDGKPSMGLQVRGARTEEAPAGTGAAEAAAAGGPQEPSFDWAVRLPVLQWQGNGWICDAIHASLTAASHVLVTRSGPALQPGPRRYTRSWIRDGAMMSAALLRMGRVQEVREFIRWYAPHQRADGFVPCCVDREGIDWLVEHDSHGQLIALIADYHGFTSDRPFLEESWRFVEKAVGCIEGLLDSTGLLPISVSHEGYLAQPVHSYWDDFWALRGLRDAAQLALALGRDSTARRWESLGARFAAALFASIEATRSQRQLDFIPGSVEWADFDPTATANALYLFGIPEGLDRGAVERTFDIYLTEWHGKRSGAVEWASYTPYEIRIIGALVRLGRREAALELLRFFLADRRPPAWNQWPEIAWRDARTPAHVGDLPHTWIAAEYVLALRSLFAYERESDRSLVLAAGLAPEWIEGEGVRVDKMPTLYGALSYSLRRVDSRTLRLSIGGGIAAKLVLRPPLGAPLIRATVDGNPPAGMEGDAVTVLQTPAEIVFTT